MKLVFDNENKNNLLVIPNCVIEKKNDLLYFDPASQNFINDLINLGMNLTVIGFCGFDITNTGFNQQNSCNLKLLSLGIRKEHESMYQKIFLYLRAAKLIAGMCKRKKFAYVFLPGHVGIIFSFISAISSCPFGIYLRGDLQIFGRKSLGIIKAIKCFIVKKAIFSIVTSYSQFHFVKSQGTEVSLVVPMTSINRNSASIIQKKNSQFTILYVGQMIREKGVFDIIETVSLLKEQGYDVNAHLVGEGSDLKALKKRVTELDLNQSFTFFGFIEDKIKLSNIYHNASVFLFPSYYPEGFPRVLYEAMICRVPIVTTCAGSIQDLMKDEENCLFIPAKVPDVIAKCVARFYNHQTFREVIINKASKTYEEHIKKVSSGLSTGTTHGQQLAKALKKHWLH